MKIIGRSSAVRTEEFDKKKKREERLRLSLFTIGGLLLVLAPIFTLRLSDLKINSVILRGNIVTKDEELKKVVLDEINGNYLWVFPKSSALLYPEEKVEESLMKKIPRLASASASLDGAKSLLVEVEERDPVALYCREVTAQTLEDCYFLDASGYIFSKSPSFSHGVYLVYGSEPVLPNPLGEEYMSEMEFANIFSFMKSGEKLFDAAALLKKNDEYEVLLRDGGIIRLRVGDDLSNALSNLESFIEDDTFRKEGNAWERLEYIDLRFGNKIFFKFEE